MWFISLSTSLKHEDKKIKCQILYVNLRIQLNIPVINMFGERFEQFKPLNKNINKLDHSKKIQINRNMMQKIYTQQRLIDWWYIFGRSQKKKLA